MLNFNHIACAVSVAAGIISIGGAAFVNYRLHTANLPAPPPPLSAKVVNGREPVLRSVVVLEERKYGGSEVASSFNYSIRDTAYLVESEGLRYVMYSPHLPPLTKKTTVRGWFVHLDITDRQITGDPTFIVPLEYGVIHPSPITDAVLIERP